MSGDVRNIVYGQEARAKLLEGSRKVYEAVKSTYGVSGNNVIIEKGYGDPILTRDGVTVATDVFLEDKAENQGAKLVIQASKKTNDRAGDGTSATVVLAYHILSEATKLVAGGNDPMKLRKSILDSVSKVKDFIDSKSVIPTNKQLVDVAFTACGDKAIGQLIADTVVMVGINGGITIEEHTNITTEREMVDGFYFDRGYADINMCTDYVSRKAEHGDIPILISRKRINTNAQIVPLLEKISASPNRKIMIIGELGGEALATFVMNKARGAIDGVAVGIPMFGDMEALFMEDVAMMTGGRVIQEAEEMHDVTLDDLGLADKIVVTSNSTTIIGGDGKKSDVDKRIADIKESMETETNTLYQERLEMRLAKLEGKIAIIRVGSSSDVAREELKFRVEDAVNATQNARKEGIVPGGGTTLLFGSELEIEPVLKRAMQKCFVELLSNAGENAEYKLEEVLRSGFGNGYNLRDIKDKPENMIKAGVIDPSLTLKQVVDNASDVSANMVTTGCVITYKDRPDNKVDADSVQR